MAVSEYVSQVNGHSYGIGYSARLVDQHPCVSLRDFAREPNTLVVCMETLKDRAALCPECNFLLHIASSFLEHEDWTDVVLSLTESYPCDMFFVSGRARTNKTVDDNFTHTAPFFLATKSG